MQGEMQYNKIYTQYIQVRAADRKQKSLKDISAHKEARALDKTGQKLRHNRDGVHHHFNVLVCQHLQPCIQQQLSGIP